MFSAILCNALIYTFIASEYNDWGWIFPFEQWSMFAPLVLFLVQVFVVLPVAVFRNLLGGWINLVMMVSIGYFSTGVIV